MSSKLPESTRLAYARQLADEAKTLVPGMERLSAIARELRADDLFRLLGFDTWERFCVDYLGVSKWTANRWISGDKPKSIGAGQSVAAVQDAPIVESDTLKIPAASTEAPAKQSEGGGTGTNQPPAVVDHQRTPSGPSSGGAGIQPTPTGPTGEPSPPLSAPPDPTVDVDAIGLRWLKSKTTQQVRAIGDPWGPAIRSEVRRWAEAFGSAPAPAEKPQRRQGTITRPSGDPPTLAVARLAIEAPRAKRHSLDCSCLSCKAPKAVAK